MFRLNVSGQGRGYRAANYIVGVRVAHSWVCDGLRGLSARCDRGTSAAPEQASGRFGRCLYPLHKSPEGQWGQLRHLEGEPFFGGRSRASYADSLSDSAALVRCASLGLRRIADDLRHSLCRDAQPSIWHSEWRLARDSLVAIRPSLQRLAQACVRDSLSTKQHVLRSALRSTRALSGGVLLSGYRSIVSSNSACIDRKLVAGVRRISCIILRSFAPLNYRTYAVRGNA